MLDCASNLASSLRALRGKVALIGVDLMKAFSLGGSEGVGVGIASHSASGDVRCALRRVV